MASTSILSSLSVAPSACFFPSQEPAGYSCDSASKADSLCFSSWNNNWGQVQGVLSGLDSNEELIEVAEEMLDVDFQDERSYSALHYSSANGNVQITEALLSVGCDENARDKDGNTALLFAASNNSEEHFQVLVALIEHGTNPNVQNFNGESALHLAAMNGNKATVAFLVENGAFVNCKTLDGETPLHLAISSGPYLDVVSYLLSHGAFVNAQDDEGDSPLHFLVRSFDVKNGVEQQQALIQLLLKAGANVDLVNEDEESPIELARQLGETQLANYLAQFSQRRVNNIPNGPAFVLVEDKSSKMSPFVQTPTPTANCMGAFGKFSVEKNEGSALSSLSSPVQHYVPYQPQH